MHDGPVDIKRDDEIDLVDVITVLIKRKIIILSIVLAALLVSGLFTLKSIKNIKYTAELSITPPRELSIDNNNVLILSNVQMDIFLNNVRKSLYERSYSTVNGKRVASYTFQIEKKEDSVTGSETVRITLTGKKEKVIESIKVLYSIYESFEREIELRNEKISKIANTILETDLKEKTDMLERLKRLISEGKFLSLPQGSETAIVNAFSSLSSETAMIKKTIELNNNIKLMGGNFYLIRTNKWEYMEPINPNMFDKLETYLRPEKSKKRIMLPIVLSVFLAFFVGIFMAFIVEFFSKEDVKGRIKEALKKS
jgi:capsular polysaccharide biosynthesis protein